MMGTTTINVARWLPRSSVNGPGERFVLWVQGCPLHCPGCWNPDTWAFTPRRVMTVAEILDRIVDSQPVDGVTFSGGEPFAQASGLMVLAEHLRGLGMSLMAFTGYELEELNSSEQRGLLGLLDIVVTGRYVRELRSDGLLWRSSTNQRVHFLSERHKALEASELPPAVAEVVIPESGRVVVTGFPDSGLLRQLDEFRVRLGLVSSIDTKDATTGFVSADDC